MFTAKDYDQALLTPQKIFDLPMEVVETESYDHEPEVEGSEALGSGCQ